MLVALRFSRLWKKASVKLAGRNLRIAVSLRHREEWVISAGECKVYAPKLNFEHSQIDNFVKKMTVQHLPNLLETS